MRERLRWNDNVSGDGLVSTALSSVGKFSIYKNIDGKGFVAILTKETGEKISLGNDSLISKVRACCQNAVDKTYTYGNYS